MADSIDNREDVIDSRQVIERIEELQERAEDAEEAIEAGEEPSDPLDDDETAELAALLKLQEQAEGYADWKHGAMLIRDSYFKAYAQEFAKDIGAIKKDFEWPYTCIDWDKAADELQVDYTSVEFDGVTYWVR